MQTDELASRYGVIQGDAFDLIDTLEDNSLDLLLTSPPYYKMRSSGRIGNEKSVDEYLANLVDFFQQVKRKMKTTGNIVVNLGDKSIDGSLQLIPYRFAIKMLDAGFMMPNVINWVKPNPVPKPHKKRLVSSIEPFFHFTLSNAFYSDTDRWGDEDHSPKPLSRPKSTKYWELIDKSELTPSQKVSAREALQAVLQSIQRGEISDFRMKIKGIHALPYGGMAGGRTSQILNNGFSIIRLTGKSMKKDTIVVPVSNVKGRIHDAAFPLLLAEKIIGLLCPSDGVILDPFVGSGTTIKAALNLNRISIGFEINEGYYQDALIKLESFFKEKYNARY